jgi:adenylyl- and sulfurtransferase ThiI
MLMNEPLGTHSGKSSAEQKKTYQAHCSEVLHSMQSVTVAVAMRATAVPIDVSLIIQTSSKGLGGLPYTENRENNQSAFRLPSG